MGNWKFGGTEAHLRPSLGAVFRHSGLEEQLPEQLLDDNSHGHHQFRGNAHFVVIMAQVFQPHGDVVGILRVKKSIDR